MIEHYPIKFAPAVSQKELQKKLLEGDLTVEETKKFHQMKARVEVVGDFADIKKIGDLLKELSKK
jgi:hypothetical protein